MDDLPAIPGFACQALIGSGRHGGVWRAIRASDGAVLALKVVPTGRVADAARFLREGRILASLDHPHIIRCHACGQTDEVLWLAMDLAAGDLAAVVRRGPCDPRRVLEIGRDAADGVGELARRGLVHRDLTPANLLLLADGRCVLGDFGLVRADHERLTADGQVLGTPAYTAPEQARGELADAASDIYALGACLYALATGGPPFRGDGGWAVLNQVAAGPFPDPLTARPDLPLELRAIIRAATGPGAAERYARAGDLGEDCAAVLAGGVPRRAGQVRARIRGAPAIPELPVVGATPAARPGQLAAVVATGLLAGFALGWSTQRDDPAERAAFANASAEDSLAAWQVYRQRFPASPGTAAATTALSVLGASPAPPDCRERDRLAEACASAERAIARLAAQPAAIPSSRPP